MFKTVLVPVDVSLPEDAKKVLSAAKAITEPWNCDIHAATIVPDMGMAIVGSFFDKGFEAQSLDQAKAELQDAIDQTGIRAEMHVLSGSVYDRILALADKLQADLIILGAHSPELRDYLLGSNAAQIVRHSPKSVLVLRD